MTNVTTTTNSLKSTTDPAIELFDNCFDPIESGVRDRVREFIEELHRGDLDEALARPAIHGQSLLTAARKIAGHRHGSRTRSLSRSFGKTEINVPRARLQAPDGKTVEW